MRRRHRRIMFQFERDQPAIPPDDAGEAGHAAAAAGLQRGEFGCRIEILRLDGDAAHPPVTGGKIASSRASPMGLSSGTKRWSSAARSLTARSEEHTSELQSLMRISYAVFFLKKKKTHNTYMT